jgi:hypothetical protein
MFLVPQQKFGPGVLAVRPMLPTDMSSLTVVDAYSKPPATAPLHLTAAVSMPDGWPTQPTPSKVLTAQDKATDTEVAWCLLTSVYSLADEGLVDKGISVIFKALDHALRNNDFAMVNSFMALANTTRLPSEILLAPLAITLAAKSRLSDQVRDSYITRARQRMLILNSDVRYVDELIARFA